MNTDYYHKYLKYKSKYLALRGGMVGGMIGGVLLSEAGKRQLAVKAGRAKLDADAEKRQLEMGGTPITITNDNIDGQISLDPKFKGNMAWGFLTNTKYNITIDSNLTNDNKKKYLIGF